jgi:hypothetical protein
MLIQFDWLHVLFVAVLGSALTMAIKTGSFAPVFPQVTRQETPGKFWLWVGFCSFFVVGFFVGIIFLLIAG